MPEMQWRRYHRQTNPARKNILRMFPLAGVRLRKLDRPQDSCQRVSRNKKRRLDCSCLPGSEFRPAKRIIYIAEILLSGDRSKKSPWRKNPKRRIGSAERRFFKIKIKSALCAYLPSPIVLVLLVWSATNQAMLTNVALKILDAWPILGGTYIYLHSLNGQKLTVGTEKQSVISASSAEERATLCTGHLFICFLKLNRN